MLSPPDRAPRWATKLLRSDEQVVWMSPDCHGDKAVIIRAHCKPESVTKEAAGAFLEEEPEQE